MDNYADWIGKKEILTDFTNSRPVAMMQALLNQSDKKLTQLPHLFHWFYFLPIVNGQQLAEDGHPQKGDFLPPIPYPKRMWAGSRLKFIAPIAINQQIKRESEIIKIEFKQGKSGDMYFVTLKHSIFADDILAIEEEQDIVYREHTPQQQHQAPSKILADSTRTYCYKKQFPVNTVTLFRYSALTFNAHKIHYDLPYATQKEGYPGLVIHGPLLATLLLHCFKQENTQTKISSFEFRAVSPVFGFNEFYLCGDIQTNNGELWIEKTDGQIAMKAKVIFEGECSCNP